MAINKDWVFRRGDLYMANLNPYKGSEQGGTRPVVVLQNNDGNFHNATLIIAPLMTRMKKEYLPTHYLVEHAKGLDAPSIVELEQVKTIDKKRIVSYLGKICPKDMDGIDDALKKSLGLCIPISSEAP